MKIKSLILILALLIIISSCKGQNIDYNYHSGIKGLEMSFVDNTPPKEVYEGDIVPVNIRLANLGAKDVDLNKVFFQIRGDNFYITTSEEGYNSQSNEDYNSLSRIIDNDLFDKEKNKLKILHGKSYIYPQGELSWLYPYIKAKKIVGTREQPSTSFYAEICYPYETLFSAPVCVDVNPYDEDKRKQICEAKEQTFNGGQGGPLAITRINNIPQFVRRNEAGGRGVVSLVQPSFEIEISNKGSGIVVTDEFKNSDDKKNIANICQLKEGTISLQDINRFKIKAYLNDVALDCTPAKPYLKASKVVVKCVVPIKDITYTTTNYQDTLRINLTYIYKDAISAGFEIARSSVSNYNDEDLTYLEKDLNPAFVHGEARCNYCYYNPESSECNGWPDKTKKLINTFIEYSSKTNQNFNLKFSCSCSQEVCYKYAADGACVIGSTWCSGSNYCCDPEYDQKKSEATKALEKLKTKKNNNNNNNNND